MSDDHEERHAEDAGPQHRPESASQESVPSITKRLQAMRARSSESARRADAMLDAVDTVRAELERRVATAEASSRRLEGELRRMEDEKSSLQDQLASRIDAVTEAIEQQMKALDSEFSTRLAGIEEGEQEVESRVQRFEALSEDLKAMIAATEHVGPGLKQLLSSVDDMRAGIGASIERMATVREDLRASIEVLSKAQEHLADQVAHLEGSVAETRARLSESTKHTMDELEAKLAIVERRSLEARELSVLSPSEFPYFRFEDLHRGSAESVRDSIRPFVRPFIRCQRVVDLGCGRGEFLDLCNQEGIGAYGVDSNEDMVLHCQRIGLSVQHDDIIEHLRGLKDKSLDGIFCSQVIEHLSMRKVQALFREGFRVLKVGTNMVIVTINPLSLYALANNFYLDPTHVRPLPPETMRFLAEDAGFRKLTVSYFSPFGPDYSLLPVRFEQETEEYRAIRVNFDRLNHVVFGYQEYALVGLK